MACSLLISLLEQHLQFREGFISALSFEGADHRGGEVWWEKVRQLARYPKSGSREELMRVLKLLSLIFSLGPQPLERTAPMDRPTSLT